MFDFNKADIIKTPLELFTNNPLLEFIIDCNTRTGELAEYNQIAEYRKFEFSVKLNKYLNVKGSFHKYWDTENANYKDYTINDYYLTLNELEQKFNINPFNAILHNLEFGVNVILPFKTQTFLNSIISFKGKEYKKESFNGRGYLLRFEFGQFELKIYDKGFQYLQQNNILRFEIKVKKMEYLKSKNIHLNNYTDLLNIENINKLKSLLIKTFKELLIYDDTIEINTIKKRIECEILLNGKNPKYWNQLKLQNKNTYKKKRTRFRELVLKYGSSNNSVEVLSLIESKLNDITTIDESLKVKIDYLNRNKSFESVPILTTLNSKCTHFNSSSIGLNRYTLFKPFTFGRIELVIV
jgi:hypothetical protein